MKYLFLDLDGTICESRQIISSKMKKKLLSLKEPFIVISGAEKKRIKKQMDGVPCIMMGQNGNHAPDWYNKLTNRELVEINRHIDKIPFLFGDDSIQNRGCQVSVSFTGHNAPIEEKKEFDPNKTFRKMILKKCPFKSKTLTIKIAGTTCFDYNRKGCLKGDN